MIKVDGSIGSPRYDLLVFNSNLGPSSPPSRDIRVRKLSDGDFDFQRHSEGWMYLARFLYEI